MSMSITYVNCMSMTWAIVFWQGSCTACVAVLEGNRIHIANLGDSGLMILRKEDIVLKTVSQQHSFNLPYQLGRGGAVGSIVDPPNAADVSCQAFAAFSTPYHQALGFMHMLAPLLKGCPVKIQEHVQVMYDFDQYCSAVCSATQRKWSLAM